MKGDKNYHDYHDYDINNCDRIIIAWFWNLNAHIVFHIKEQIKLETIFYTCYSDFYADIHNWN